MIKHLLNDIFLKYLISAKREDISLQMMVLVNKKLIQIKKLHRIINLQVIRVMYKRLDLNETNISDRCYSRSSSKRKISVVSIPSSRRIEQPIEIKAMLNGFLGCSKGKIISQRDIQSVIDMEVKRKLSVCQPNIPLSLKAIPSEIDRPNIEKAKILWSPNSPINRLLTLQ